MDILSIQIFMIPFKNNARRGKDFIIKCISGSKLFSITFFIKYMYIAYAYWDNIKNIFER